LIFAKYLKVCRVDCCLTQEEFVNQCYAYDEVFQGLDVGTLSRWERGVNTPSVDKQIKITRIFQSYTKSVLPCFENYTKEEIEAQLSHNYVKNLIGNSKKHILNFPDSQTLGKEIQLLNIQEISDKQSILKMPSDILRGIAENYYGLTEELLLSWAEHKNNLFVVSEYRGQFFGMMFVLRLKPDVFDDILMFHRELKTLTQEDFAQDEELGCSFPVAFFAYNQRVASLLYLRFYADLIANQAYILEVGNTLILQSVAKLVEKINLKKYKVEKKSYKSRTSYRASLSDVLLSEDVFRMIFQK